MRGHYKHRLEVCGYIPASRIDSAKKAYPDPLLEYFANLDVPEWRPEFELPDKPRVKKVKEEKPIKNASRSPFYDEEFVRAKKRACGSEPS